MAGFIEAILGIRTQNFRQGLNQAKGDAQKFKQETSSIFSGLGKTIAGALTVTAAITAFKSLMDFSGQLQDQSDALNVNIEALQRYQQVFGQSGTSAEGFAKGIGKLNESVAAALGGDEKKIEAFERMGISLQDLAENAGEPINLLPKMADGLKNAADKGARLTDVNDILGKSGRTMAAGLAQGSAEMKKSADAATIAAAKHIAFFDNIGDAAGRFVSKAKAMGIGAIATMFDPESWKNGGWKGAGGTLPGDNVPTPEPPKGQGPFGTYHGTYVEDPREKKAQEQAAKDHEAEMKYMEETATQINRLTEVRKKAGDEYLNNQEKIKAGIQEVARLEKKAKGNSPLEAAKLTADAEALKLQTISDMADELQKSPAERLQGKRAQAARERALNKAGREFERMKRQGKIQDVVPGKQDPSKMTAEQLDKANATLTRIEQKMEATK